MKKFINHILLFILITFSSIFAQNSGWRIFGEMKHPVSGAQIVVRDSLIYLIGGYSDSLQANVRWIQEFNPQANTWRIVGNIDEKRYGFYAGIHNDKVYLFGGINEVNEKAVNLEEWDFQSSSTTVVQSNDNFDRVFPIGAIYNDNIFIMGGFSGSRGSSALLQYFVNYNFGAGSFNILDDTTFQTNELPIQQMSVLIDNEFYVFGGAYNGILQTFDIINLDSYELTSQESRLINSRAAGEAVYFENAEQILLIGGYNETSPSISSVEVIYDFRTADPQVVSGPSLNYARRNLSAVYFDESVYVFGGENANGAVVSQIEVLDSAIVGVNDEEALDKDFTLYQNYPNPFNPETTILFAIPESKQVSIEIYNSIGQKISTLYDKFTSPGSHKVKWDGKGSNGEALSSGVYFYRLSFGQQKYITKKMMLLK